MSKDLSSIKQSNVWQFGLSVFVATLIFYTSQYLPIFVLVIFLSSSGKNQQQVTDLFTDNHLMQFFALFLIAATTIYLIYRYLRRQGKNPITYLRLNRPPSLSELGDVVIAYGLYFATLLFATVIVSAFTTVDVNQVQELGIADPQTFNTQLLVFLSLVVLPPISEEILFRGFLFQKLKKHSSVIIATVAVSILFGVAHLEYSNLNWIAVVDTLIFSVYLIYIFEKHKSLYSPMILHGIKNSIAFYILFIY